jgi:hypothetical protein
MFPPAAEPEIILTFAPCGTMHLHLTMLPVMKTKKLKIPESLPKNNYT